MSFKLFLNFDFYILNIKDVRETNFKKGIVSKHCASKNIFNILNYLNNLNIIIV